MNAGCHFEGLLLFWTPASLSVLPFVSWQAWLLEWLPMVEVLWWKAVLGLEHGAETGVRVRERGGERVVRRNSYWICGVTEERDVLPCWCSHNVISYASHLIYSYHVTFVRWMAFLKSFLLRVYSLYFTFKMRALKSSQTIIYIKAECQITYDWQSTTYCVCVNVQ